MEPNENSKKANQIQQPGFSMFSETFNFEKQSGLNEPEPANAYLGDKYYGSEIQYSIPSVSLDKKRDELISSFSPNIGAIVRFGKIVASGVLVWSDLFLTCQHAVNDQDDTIYNITFDGGQNYVRATVIEARKSSIMDFAILKLDKETEGFKSILLDLSGQPSTEVVIIGHLGGNKKNGKIYKPLTSSYVQYRYSYFRDPHPGSSGSSNFTFGKKLISIHSSHQSGQADSFPLKYIYDESKVLQSLYNNNGEYKTSWLKSPKLLVDLKEIHISENSTSSEYEERIPISKPISDLFGKVKTGESRHHVIPIGDMSYLWYIGRECPELKEIITGFGCLGTSTLLYEKYSQESVAWAGWNLFIGPNQRSDDPKNEIESVRPLSFPETIWNCIRELYKIIIKCWEKRKLLSDKIEGSISIEGEKAAALTFQKYLLRERNFIERFDYEVDLKGDLIHSDAYASLPEKISYVEYLMNIRSKLNDLQEALNKHQEQFPHKPNKLIYPLERDPNDWDKKGKYFLKG